MTIATITRAQTLLYDTAPAAEPRVGQYLALRSDKEMMVEFATAIFKKTEHKGWIALRAFEHSLRGFPVGTTWAQLDHALVQKASVEATRIANLREPSAVFSPPLCVFTGELDERGRRRAREVDILSCPVLSVELDERPRESKQLLIETLGPPTVEVLSGGTWTGPGGESEDRLHLHWRLPRPAMAEELPRLKMARCMASALVGADRTAVPLAHPMRWPGSWHTKKPQAPRMSEIASIADVEIDLPDALTRLEMMMFIKGVSVGTKRSVKADVPDLGGIGLIRSQRDGWKTAEPLSNEQLVALARGVPNDAGAGWADWNTVGMGFHDASHGSDDGREAFHEWSGKAGDLYDADRTDARWDHFGLYPSSDLGAGGLIHRAREADPTFVLPGSHPITAPSDWYALPSEVSPKAGAAPVLADNPELPEHINRLNRAHAFVMNGGKAVIVNEYAGGGISFSSRSSFEERYANDTVMNGRRPISVARSWFEHPGRRQYLDGVDFAPEGAPPGVYNLWRGFGVTPDPSAGCDLFIGHLRENVCQGHEGHFRWVTAFFAQMVQQPGDKPGVALALRGGQGVGKSIVGEYVGAMFPLHHVTVSQSDHLTGRFNAHLDRALLIQAEEAFWAGNRNDGGPLKDLVTSPRMRIERKGIDTIEVRNNARLLITTNNRWAVPAGLDERRFAVFDVGEARQQDSRYFGEIMAELRAGGAAALLHYLLDFDLSSVNLRTLPETAALLEQKVESFRPHQRWWFEVLKQGSIGHVEGWPAEMGRDGLYDLYCRYAAGISQRALPNTTWGHELHVLCPALDTRRPRTDGGRPRIYLLPPLDRCRADFAHAVRSSIDWDGL